MAKNKTTQTTQSVAEFISQISDEKRRQDILALSEMVTRLTGFQPKMWGPSIIGFGAYNYKYESGHEGTAPLTGLASRANAIVVYLNALFDDKDELLTKLGKHKMGKGCLYIPKLEAVDQKVLGALIEKSVKHLQQLYPG